METNKALALVDNEEPVSLSPVQVRNQVNLIQQILREIMIDGTHFGKIPGCGPKPTLLKAGAEKLCLTFRLAPDYEELPGSKDTEDFICYKIKCSLTHIPTGKFMGAGFGTCNSKEIKYKSRAPMDIQNTLYKMACKRAHVMATIAATGCSDIFTQDLEDMSEPLHREPAKITSVTHKAPPANPEKKKAAGNPGKSKEAYSEVKDGQINVFNSFMIKEQLKLLGARWNGDLNAWSLPDSEDSIRAVCHLTSEDPSKFVSEPTSESTDEIPF